VLRLHLNTGTVPNNVYTEIMTTESLYQVDFVEENLGQFLLPKAKKRVSWVFRIHRGDGTDHQHDQEHTISLTWSKGTGKQDIYMDGREVWFGRREGARIFDYSWTTRDGQLNFHMLATRAPKLNDSFRKYDLLINNRLFADLPRCGSQGGCATNYDIMENEGHPRSIIEVLYPNGYTPPPQFQSVPHAPAKDSFVPFQAEDTDDSQEEVTNEHLPSNDGIDLLG
jgi:hypothetical protein